MEKSELYPEVYIKDFGIKLFSEIMTQSFFGKELITEEIDGKSYAMLITELLEKSAEPGQYPEVLLFGRRALRWGHRKSLR